MRNDHRTDIQLPMNVPRREFLVLSGAAFFSAELLPSFLPPRGSHDTMYGLIGQMMAVPGQRDALAAILMRGTAAMPGCLSYIIATDPANPDALWITEVWDSAESHNASLSLPAVQAAIAVGRPLIAGFGQRTETIPLGGTGLTGSEHTGA